MYYELSGPSDAPPLVLSHSLATSNQMWLPQLDLWSTRYRVLAYDLRGHGRSGASAGNYSIQGLAEDVLALLDHLQIERAHFAGLSLGGMIGQYLGAHHPQRLRSLILACTMFETPTTARAMWEERAASVMREGMEPMVQPTLGRWFTQGFAECEPDTVARLARMIRATSPTGYAGCCRTLGVLDLSGSLARIAVPTLVIAGEQDRSAATVETAKQMVSAIPGSRLSVIDGAAHIANVEKPAEFQGQADVFLKQIG